ncbi:Zinc finger HIT domain-containing protein 1 [Desmophyllum pertusum]|uniref:Zinc finger HIT domain-containing protein 1 n=1 Tax=Desmophyllum pertusum TaxID=174260 RepID=A0A9W9YD94_9CNID|nr:Zinc finger HIT domain-containing protein 1 [Desmophyllum pertusum]
MQLEKDARKDKLEALEKDNFQDDTTFSPDSSSCQIERFLPLMTPWKYFVPHLVDKRKKRKSKTGELFKQRFRRTFAMLLEEAQQEAEAGEPSYNSANVPPSKLPERHFCSVCGYPFNIYHFSTHHW